MIDVLNTLQFDRRIIYILEHLDYDKFVKESELFNKFMVDV